MFFGKYAEDHFSNTWLVLFQILLVVPLMLGLGYGFHLLFERPFMNTPRAKVSAVPMPAPAVPPIREFARDETNHL
jgi:peptidoglycan/LPS O-acetylase OafA/YrhL